MLHQTSLTASADGLPVPSAHSDSIALSADRARAISEAFAQDQSAETQPEGELGPYPPSSRTPGA